MSVTAMTLVATSCTGVMPPAQYNLCKQTSVDNPKLRLRINDLPDPFGTNESLAAAVCCDSRNEAYAEPQNLYDQLGLFAALDPQGITTFYDSACGLPLFRTPVNRTLAEFEADTKEHGWPSFREGEVFHDNVRTNSPKPGLVTSACGTHLGSYLPDGRPRWCIDLSCVAGTADWKGCCSQCGPGGASGCGSGKGVGKCIDGGTVVESAATTASEACDCAC